MVSTSLVVDGSILTPIHRVCNGVLVRKEGCTVQLKQLEVFVQVARLRSFSRAADALYLTQPTVSAHISALETELGAQLMLRSTRELQLTAAGQALLHYAVQIMGLTRKAEEAVRAAGDTLQGALTIAASTVPSQYLLPRVLAKLHQRWPEIRFQISQGDSGEAARRVAEHEAELGIIGTPVRRAGCECISCGSERLVIVTPNTEAYANLSGFFPAEKLRTAPFLVREPGSGTRRQSETFLKGIGVEPRSLRVAAQLQSTEAILQGVRYGLGIAIVSGLAAAEYASTGHILIFDYESPLLTRQFYLFYHRGRPLSPAAEQFRRELPRMLKELLC